jgi:hypothetical protein
MISKESHANIKHTKKPPKNRIIRILGGFLTRYTIPLHHRHAFHLLRCAILKGCGTHARYNARETRQCHRLYGGAHYRTRIM